MRIGIYGLLLITGLCNNSAIRLCAVDLPERAKGAVKSNFGLAYSAEAASAAKAGRVYRELGRGSRGARGTYLSRSLFPQKTPAMGVFCGFTSL